MKIRKWIAGLALVALAAVPGSAGVQTIREYVLFYGADTDTTQQVSTWIPVRGASRVYIRTYTKGAATDTNYCDSITTWKTMFSDSIKFVVRDSLGTLSSVPATEPNTYNSWPICADSTVITGDQADTLHAVAVGMVPTTRPIRGTGAYCVVYPVNVGNISADYGGVIPVQYMRIAITPRTRLTTAGFSSTAGIRTIGIHGLRMRAYVVMK